MSHDSSSESLTYMRLLNQFWPCLRTNEYFSAVISTHDGSVHSCACDSTAHWHFLLLLCWECVLCHTSYHLMFILLSSWFTQLYHTLWVRTRSWTLFYLWCSCQVIIFLMRISHEGFIYWYRWNRHFMLFSQIKVVFVISEFWFSPRHRWIDIEMCTVSE